MDHFCLRNGHDVRPPRKGQVHGYCYDCRMYTCCACSSNGHHKKEGYCINCGQYDGGQATVETGFGNGTSTDTMYHEEIRWPTGQ